MIEGDFITTARCCQTLYESKITTKDTKSTKILRIGFLFVLFVVEAFFQSSIVSDVCSPSARCLINSTVTVARPMTSQKSVTE